MTTYCPACGFANEYRGTKPSTCASCNESFSKHFTPVARVESPPSRTTQSYHREETVASVIPQMDLGSLKIEMGEKMTVASLRNSGVTVERGQPDEKRQEIVQDLLKNHRE